jgi:uncharacterized protein YdcH (DUF465 family)
MADPTREELLADEHFRQLMQEHAAYEQRLAALMSKPRPSEDEQIEETRLKKLKLRIKDEMLDLERRHRCPAPAA